MAAETIFALASGLGRAAIAVVRLSGPATREVLTAIAGDLPPPRTAALSTLRVPGTGELIDRGLLLYYPGPRSFTGEDTAEFQVHGSPAVLKALFGALESFRDVRPAEAGEFTRRAFLNGKLDLAQVEGLADLIAAETERQRRQATRQLGGALSSAADYWRRSLVHAAALIESDIDFADEADVSTLDRSQVLRLCAPVETALDAELARAHAGERLRDGLTIVIAGPPNAGKSTLLNALAGREAAIVTPHAGTTRDPIEVALDISGYPVTLIDTAGLRETRDAVEEIGVARARQRAQTADLILWLSEALAPSPPDPSLRGEVWPVFTKSDLLPAGASRNLDGLYLSAATGEHVETLISVLARFAETLVGTGESVLITNARHRRAFATAASALARLREASDAPIEFVAEELRLATRALESVAGRVDVEDILGEIFSRFCIGK